ncbi:MAG: uroporphyrinogen-III synthase [Gemmatimonadota bacterium]
MKPAGAAPAARPLDGRRVVVTRPETAAGGLLESLRGLGAVALLRPGAEILPLEDPAPLDRALRALRAYDWVVFTSANGVRHAWSRLEELGLAERFEDGEHGRLPGAPRVAAIGPATAAALERRGVRADFVPRDHVAESLARGLPLAAGAAVLLLRADIGRRMLPDLLRRRGATVDDVAAYRTVVADDRDRAPDDAPRTSGGDAGEGAEPPVDAVTFTSPSTVRGFLAAHERVPASAAVVCIGPITARAARELGLRVDAVAERSTVAGLVEALVRHFEAGAGAAGRPRGVSSGT